MLNLGNDCRVVNIGIVVNKIQYKTSFWCAGQTLLKDKSLRRWFEHCISGVSFKSVAAAIWVCVCVYVQTMNIYYLT